MLQGRIRPGGREHGDVGVRPPVNYSLGGNVTSGYVQHSTERLRVPAQRVADELAGRARSTTGLRSTNVCQKVRDGKG